MPVRSQDRRLKGSKPVTLPGYYVLPDTNQMVSGGWWALIWTAMATAQQPLMTCPTAHEVQTSHLPWVLQCEPSGRGLRRFGTMWTDIILPSGIPPNLQCVPIASLSELSTWSKGAPISPPDLCSILDPGQRNCRSSTSKNIRITSVSQGTQLMVNHLLEFGHSVGCNKILVLM